VRYWRSLEHLVGSSESGNLAQQEFPGYTNIYEDLGEAELLSEPEALATGLSRRQFISLSAAALGLAAASGCRRPDLQILPYTHTPENIVPGVPLFYATAMPKPGGCFPILVESHDGRPTKIEGHPKHPASLGACDVHTQASILDLYSPDRSKEVLKRGPDGKLAPSTWEEFDAFAAKHFAELKKKEGEGLAFLLEDNPSPAMRLLREHMKTVFPKAVWCVWEPFGKTNELELAKHLGIESVDVRYRFGAAQRILALDCDFLGSEGNTVVNGRAFAGGRRRDSEAPKQKRNRLYVVESTYSVTGAMADHRLRLPAAHIFDFLGALTKALVERAEAKDVPDSVREIVAGWQLSRIEIPSVWIDEVATDLREFRGKSLVIAGYRQPPGIHALCSVINGLLLGNIDATVSYEFATLEQSQKIGDLGLALHAGEIKTLVVLGGNPVHNAPADLNLAASIGQASTVIRVGLFEDETSHAATWHLPQAHFLESWGDAETADDSYCCIQPMIATLHNGRSSTELLIQISGWDGVVTAADARIKAPKLVRDSFKKRTGKDDELTFKRFVQEGFVADSARPPVIPMERAIQKFHAAGSSDLVYSKHKFEVTFHPSYALYDGRFAWNSWLMELPDPITKLVWDNAALVSPKTAEHLQIKTGDVIEIDNGSAKVKIPAFILPGQADNSIALHLGWGKQRIAHAGAGGGFDVYPLRTSNAMHFTTAKVTKTGEFYDLVTTQEHGTIPGEKAHDIIQEFTLDEFHEREHAEHHNDDPKSRFQWGYDQSKYRDAGPSNADVRRIALQQAQDLSAPQRLDGHMQWGMVIDLNVCTGCSACVIACQAENNIPVVGKHEVKLNREMHWISVHRYFTSENAENPGIVTQPMMCQHCEAAPCESVCPVNAAVHSPEGLNLQVYNRCIGTRYCSNNCPYKARRFNWFDFNKRRLDELRVPTPFSEAGVPETLKMQKNPDVTVRMRGVMEKCTYCIQRIERAKIGAKVAAAKAGDDKADTPPTTDPKQEYAQGYAIRVIDGISRIIVPDGIIKTACEQVCPTGAIVFGNVRDETSRVYKLKNAGPDYLVLGSLNTKPRTSYLPRLRNPNPKMGEGT
jgi:molybdopterin-containing oxidoreductase family iron-sulfur binding subunit